MASSSSSSSISASSSISSSSAASPASCNSCASSSSSISSVSSKRMARLLAVARCVGTGSSSISLFDSDEAVLEGNVTCGASWSEGAISVESLSSGSLKPRTKPTTIIRPKTPSKVHTHGAIPAMVRDDAASDVLGAASLAGTALGTSTGTSGFTSD